MTIMANKHTIINISYFYYSTITTEMDALRRSARISKLDRKTNEYIREKNGRARYDIG